MFKSINIGNELIKARRKGRKREDELLDEVKKILSADLIHEKKILSNLKYYTKSFELLDENEIDATSVFSVSDIKKTCIQFRLRFLDSQLFKNEIPYEAVLKIKDLNSKYRKEIKYFKILASANSFKKNNANTPCLLFAECINGNYYLIHSWGQELKWHNKLLLFPIRTFETLFSSLLVLTLLIDISLPVEWITLDRSAPYWCGYRIASYFHLLIFFTGFTTYVTFAFNKNFSKSNWNSPIH